MDIPDIDTSNMFESILQFPSHVKNSFNFFDKNSSISNTISNKINNILIFGMGGSAITGLLFKEILANKLSIPVIVNQGYTIPKWVNENTLVIACSYSGNTEETLIAFEECLSKTSKIIGFSTGGKLIDFINENNRDFVLIPKDLQPRAALGYSFTLMLILLNRVGYINNDIVKDFKNNLDELSKYSDIFSAQKENNISYEIAKKIFNKNPLIYAEDGIFGIIGYRFKCQLVENSKILAFNNFIPEMNHNEIEAYTEKVNAKNNFVVIWINSSDYHPRNKKRINIVKNIWSSKIDTQIDINLDLSHIKSSLIKYLIYINLVDWISYHAAILIEIDPSIIPNINELKNSL